MRWIAGITGSAVLACASMGMVAQNKPATPAKTEAAAPASAQKPLLPDAFAGWVQSEKPTLLAGPSQADAANAAALKEYGFQGGSSVKYEREGDTLTLRVLRFGDVSGSYGAYSMYRGNNWPKEDIGSGAASDHGRVLFWKGDTVVDAKFSHVSPESASELRELANQLPSLQGTKALIPPILATLPKKNLDAQTTHYAIGPTGYVNGGGALPPELIGFDRDAETVTANYSLASGPATLTLIGYPTPQMAAAQEIKIRDYIKAGLGKAQPPFPKPLVDSDQASLEVRRTGPVVVLVSGDAIPDESHRLVSMVHYESTLVAIPQPTESEVSRTGKLLVGIAGIVIVGSLAAILLGGFLGGGRALYRIARGKPASSVYETEFTRLNLRD